MPQEDQESGNPSDSSSPVILFIISISKLPLKTKLVPNPLAVLIYSWQPTF